MAQLARWWLVGLACISAAYSATTPDSRRTGGKPLQPGTSSSTRSMPGTTTQAGPQRKPNPPPGTRSMPGTTTQAGPQRKPNPPPGTRSMPGTTTQAGPQRKPNPPPGTRSMPGTTTQAGPQRKPNPPPGTRSMPGTTTQAGPQRKPNPPPGTSPKPGSPSKTEKEGLIRRLPFKNLTLDEIEQLSMVRDELTDDQETQLAGLALKNVTAEMKMSILQKFKRADRLSKFERLIVWALDERNEITSQDLRRTREEQKEWAKEALMNLSRDARKALKERLGQPGGNLTEDDIEKLEALKIEGNLTQDQRDKLDRRIANGLNETEIEEVKTALDSGVLGDNELKKLRALLKAGQLTPEEGNKLKKIAGLTSTGESISDISRGDAEIPDSFGLDEGRKAALLEAGERLRDIIDFDELSDPAALKMFLKEYEKLPEGIKELLANISGRISSMSKGEIRDLPDAMLEKMTTDSLAMLKERMTPKQRAALCTKGFLGSRKLYEKLDGPLNCDTVKAEAVKGMEEFEKKRMNKNILAKLGNPTRISGDDVEKILSTDSIDEDILNLIDAEDFLSNTKLRETAIKNGDDRVVKEKFREAKGSFSSATAADIKSMEGTKWTISDVDAFTETSIAQAVKEFLGGAEDTDFSIRAKVGEIVKKGLPVDKSQTTSDQLTSMFEVGLGEDIFDDVTDETFDSFVDSLTAQGTKGKSRTELAALGQRVKKSTQYSDAKAQTTANIKKIAAVIGLMETKYLEELSEDALGEAFNDGALKDLLDVEEDKARRLGKTAVRGIRRGNGSLTAADVKDKLGEEIFLKGLDSEDFDNIDDNTFEDEDILAMLQQGYNEMPVENQLKVIEKMKRGSRNITEKVCSLGKICQGLTLADIKSWDLSFLDVIKAAVTCKLDCNLAQLGAMAERLVDKLGEPGDSNPNYGTDTYISLSVILPGFSVKQFEMLPLDDKLPELVSKLVGTGKVTEAKLKILEKKITAYYSDDNTVSTADQVVVLAESLNDMDETEIKSVIPSSLCSETVKNTKNKDKTKVKRLVIESQAKYSRECVTGATSGPITTDNAQALGDYVCYLKAQINDFDATAVKDVAGSKLQGCPAMDAATRKKYREKIESALKITDFASLDAEKMGMIMSYLGDKDAASLAKIPKAVMSEALDYMSKLLDELDMVLEKREPLRDGVDTAALTKGNTEVVKAMVDARIAVRTAATSSASRRKRAAASLTCADVKAMGQQAKALTDAQLKELSDAVFLECLATLGKVLEWSAGQKATLASRLKTAAIHGTNLAAWTANNILDSGTLLEGLSTSDLEQLAWTTSLLGQHGSRPTWAPEQRASIVSKWLTDLKSNNVGSVTGTELNTIGHFTCGLTDSQIGTVLDAAYGEAVTKIGELSNCSESQLKAFAAKAKNVFGAVSTWSPATVSNVNNVIAGLTGSELSGMPASHLAEIRPATMAVIPPATISSLSVSQIRGLSSSQVQRITAEQQKMFNPMQLEALISAGGYKLVKDNGAETIKCSAIASVLVAMTTLFMI